MAKPEENPKPGEGKPSSFDDSEFFASEGITDDEEKDAIRSRARVNRYVSWRQKKEEESTPPKPEGKPRKKWYKNEG
jgi:hypothetical protein